MSASNSRSASTFTALGGVDTATTGAPSTARALFEDETAILMVFNYDNSQASPAAVRRGDRATSTAGPARRIRMFARGMAASAFTMRGGGLEPPNGGRLVAGRLRASLRVDEQLVQAPAAGARPERQAKPLAFAQ